MVGGAMLGYCAIGRRTIAMPPANMITSAMTHAKMGRSMKKRTMVSRPSWFDQDCGVLAAPLVSCCDDFSGCAPCAAAPEPPAGGALGVAMAPGEASTACT